MNGAEKALWIKLDPCAISVLPENHKAVVDALNGLEAVRGSREQEVTPTSSANRHPVNQHALTLLRQAGEQPSQDVDLGLPTLMLWGLDKGGLQEPGETDRDEFRDGVEALNWGDPAAVMRLLLEHPEVEFLEEKFLSEKDPTEAAGLGLDHLDSLLFYLSESYGR